MALAFVKNEDVVVYETEDTELLEAERKEEKRQEYIEQMEFECARLEATMDEHLDWV